MSPRPLTALAVAAAALLGLAPPAPPPPAPSPGAAPPQAAPAPAAARPAQDGGAGSSGSSRATLADLLTELRTLHHRSETARAAHRRTDARLRAHRARTAALGRRLDEVRADLAEARYDASRIARTQYRTGIAGLPPLAHLLLADDPQGALGAGRVLQRAAERNARTLRTLQRGERRQDALVRASRRALAVQRALARARARHDAEARYRRDRATAVLAALTDPQLAALRALEAGRSGSAPGPVTG